MIYNRNTGLKGYVDYMKTLNINGVFYIFKSDDYGSFMHIKKENIDIYGLPNMTFWSLIKEITL